MIPLTNCRPSINRMEECSIPIFWCLFARNSQLRVARSSKVRGLADSISEQTRFLFLATNTSSASASAAADIAFPRLLRIASKKDSDRLGSRFSAAARPANAPDRITNQRGFAARMRAYRTPAWKATRHVTRPNARIRSRTMAKSSCK